MFFPFNIAKFIFFYRTAKDQMESCIFCRPRDFPEDILYETDHFYVKVGYGLITPGHVMLITKHHYSCFAALPEELMVEYQKIKDLIIRSVTSAFAIPF